MIGRIVRMIANEFLRRRHAETGAGPRRLPPTSLNGVITQALRQLLRSGTRRR